MMNRYVEHYRATIPFIALRNEDLAQQPDQTLKAVFEHCGLDKAGIATARQAFTEDSQAGTRFSGKANRESGTPELQEEHLEQLRSILNAPSTQSAGCRLTRNTDALNSCEQWVIKSNITLEHFTCHAQSLKVEQFFIE